jgi:hypothetical protein
MVRSERKNRGLETHETVSFKVALNTSNLVESHLLVDLQQRILKEHSKRDRQNVVFIEYYIMHGITSHAERATARQIYDSIRLQS